METVKILYIYILYTYKFIIYELICIFMPIKNLKMKVQKRKIAIPC